MKCVRLVFAWLRNCGIIDAETHYQPSLHQKSEQQSVLAEHLPPLHSSQYARVLVLPLWAYCFRKSIPPSVIFDLSASLTQKAASTTVQAAECLILAESYSSMQTFLTDVQIPIRQARIQTIIIFKLNARSPCQGALRRLASTLAEALHWPGVNITTARSKIHIAFCKLRTKLLTQST